MFLRHGDCGGGWGIRVGGQRERDGPESAKETTQEAAGFAVGDAGWAVLEQGEADAEGLQVDVGWPDRWEHAIEAGPAADAGVAVAFGNGRSAGGGFGAVVAAEFLVAGGGAAALLAVGKDVGAFGGHGFLSGSLQAVADCEAR